MRSQWLEKRKNDLNKSQMHYARKGTITEEMEYIAGMLTGDEILQIANGDIKAAAKLALRLAKRPDLVSKMITNLIKKSYFITNTSRKKRSCWGFFT